MTIVDRVKNPSPPARTETTETTETVWSLIERQAEEHPRRIAIDDHGTEIDYGRLIRRAEAIAAALAARGVEPGGLVAVCMGRSWELLATLLGVLRAGAAYVPLDPTYPPTRLADMLEHARVQAAVVDGERTAELCSGVREVLAIDTVGEAGADGVASPQPDDLAYVLYTSGSTGRPKGVAVEHRNVVAMSRSLRTLLDDEELDGMLAAASISFDASVLEILGTLSLGGKIVLAQNILELPELPSADQVRAMVTVPTALQSLLLTGPLPAGLRCILIGGEALKRPLADQVHALESKPRLVNIYGPTETTVYVAVKEVTPETNPITIGQAMPGSRTYILDDALEPVPAGEIGELFVAGDQLARGYLHDEERTAERFLRTGDGPKGERRLYRTGDLCRWTDDTDEGEIEFLGRIDQQVKFRGFRIELEEIETTLETMPGVEAAAAAVVEGPGHRERLVGYMVPRDGDGPPVTGEAARSYLAERLPGYLVPQVVMPLDELPVLASGKLDRRALPEPPGLVGLHDPDSLQSPGSDVRHPSARRDDLVSLVRSEIASLIGLQTPEQVPVDRSIFDLGLDSLTTAELIARLGATLGIKLPASAILERSTPPEVAEHILDQMGRTAEPGSGPAARVEAPETLAGFQAQIRSYYPLFLAAKAPAWSADDKAKMVQELEHLVSGAGQDPFRKVVRTGSAHRGLVADAHTGKEREAIIWTTNLYLGLNRDPEVIAQASRTVERFGTGMGTSAAAGGVTDLHRAFEREFAELVGKPDACLFPTGYTANLGVVAGILGEGDVVVMDQLCHASIVDGARLSGARIRSFRHNDVSALETVLKAEASPYRTVLVICEGVYSMGEGAAPVDEIARVAKRYGALVLVDEAHSFGFYGPRGAGICAERGATEQVDFIMTTLSKSLGSLGGVIAARKEHVALLKTSSRAYIFQASTSPAAIAAALAALRRLREDASLRERLWEVTRYMRRRFTEAGYDLGPGDTPVVTPHFPDTEALYAVVDGLFERGVLASAVTYPVVEAGRGRLRLICSAGHTLEDVDRTVEALVDAHREVEARREGTRKESSDGPPRRSDLETWAGSFAAHLEDLVAAAPGSAPDLAVSVGLPDEEPLTLVLEGGEVTVGDRRSTDLPFCSLRLTDARAASALCSSDARGVLGSVLGGTCVLTGQIEPFVWLVGRMVDWRRDAVA